MMQEIITIQIITPTMLTDKFFENGTPGKGKRSLKFVLKIGLKNCGSVVKAFVSQAESQWFKHVLG